MGSDRAASAEQAAGRGAGVRPARDQRHLLHSANRRALARSAERYGPSTTVYNRYNRWAKQGVWLRVFERLSELTPDSLHLIDSSIVRAHQHAAGGKKGARITPSVAPVGD
jgi:transposase